MESKKEKNLLLRLFLTFFKIGAFTFGGGYAMIPLIQREAVEENHWVSDQDILDVIAIAESTPGPIAINSATFVGYKVAGFWGAFCATSGVILPSFLIILAISFVLRQFAENVYVRYAFEGIRAGVLALLGKAWYTMYKKCPKHLTAYLIAAAAFICVAFLKIHVLLVIIGCAVTGLVTAMLAQRRAEA